MIWTDQAHVGDCRRLLREMILEQVKVQCIVTSPPYWGGLRDYGHAGQFGLEATPSLYLKRMRSTFRLARDVLANDGTLWLNMGDAYMHSGGTGAQGITGERMGRRVRKVATKVRYSKAKSGLKPKDLIGMPWRLALALQADGWYLRTCIIWHKLNPMPESTKDRPTTAHEYIFLMSKRQNYYYDPDAVREPVSENTHPRRPMQPVAGHMHGPGSHKAIDHARPGGAGPKDLGRQDQGLRDSTRFGRGAGFRTKNNGVGFGYADEEPKARTKFTPKDNESFDAAMAGMVEDRNMRSVWSFPTEAFKGAHFATFPRELAARCILAGSRPGDVVLDPFFGSGTTGEVALSLGRHYIGLEINAKYVELFRHHRSTQLGMQI